MAAQKKSDVVVSDGAAYMLRAGTHVFVKTADVCSMTGKSNQWIGQLVSQGAISKRSTPHGAMFDVAETMKAYCGLLEERAKEAAGKSVNEKQETEKLDAEVSIKKAKAITAVLEAKELQGKMHRSEDVAAMTEDLIYTIRAMLLALPGRLAVDAAALSDPAEVSALIRGEAHAVMEELSRYKYDGRKYEERVRKRKSWERDGIEEEVI
jgi:phage terminase Nu1 subunit (DNA packaging protein)